MESMLQTDLKASQALCLLINNPNRRIRGFSKNKQEKGRD